MAFLEIKSYAPTPSMEVIVKSGSRSVIDCNMCDTHSHPAFVDRAYLEGSGHYLNFLGDVLGNGPGNQAS